MRDGDRSRPGMKGAGFEDARDSENGFSVESGVNTEGEVYARVTWGGAMQSVGIEDGWTIIRLFAEALAAAEADALVYRFFDRMDESGDLPKKIIMAMRSERERQDVSMARQHFYKTITEGKGG